MTVHWKTVAFEQLGLDELYALLRLRQEVFVVEQECVYQDLDDKDQAGLHMLGYDGQALVGYVRCLPPGASYADASSIGRIVVAPGKRGTGLGRELVRRGIDHNRATWPGFAICINAQSYLRRFYTSLGFEAEGDEYLEDGILHVKMRLRAAAAQGPPAAC
jgi:ElaA protein